MNDRDPWSLYFEYFYGKYLDVDGAELVTEGFTMRCIGILWMAVPEYIWNVAANNSKYGT